jgi:hypothetical protein
MNSRKLLICLAMCVPFATASATTITTASVRGLSFRLIDLAPDDGITPWAVATHYGPTWAPTVAEITLNGDWREVHSSDENSPVSLSMSADGVIGSGSAAGGASLSDKTASATAYMSGIGASNYFTANAEAWTGTANFWLSPMTAIELTGTSALHTSSTRIEEEGVATAGLGIGYIDFIDGHDVYMAMTTHQDVQTYRTTDLDGLLQLTFSNELASDRFVSLSAYASAYASGYGSAIPEPSSMMLWAAGFGALLWLRTRRRGA